MGLDEGVRMLCVSPFHFDGAYGSAFPTLVAGGSLVIPRRERLLFIKSFFTALLKEEITHTCFTPTYLRLLLSSPSSTTLSRTTLRSIGLGGEECVAIDVARLWELHPGLRVFNRYGPTEATIQVTTYEVLREDVLSGSVPIGQPHPGVTFHVVDEEGRIVRGSNEVGELHIGGNQLMRGYWGDDELTSEVLRDDVVARTRVYRTGDLVYRDLQGRYVYVGRTDSLVKRNGVRVSLHEVARVLRGADGVSDAVCLPVDKDGHLAIAAFLKARPDLTVSQVLEAVHQELPTGMVPDEVHLRAAFPLSSSGRVDRQRLAEDSELVVWSKARRDHDPKNGAAGSGAN
jgi:D-alanine--poly(phosphoribitol) ligase subunit 1